MPTLESALAELIGAWPGNAWSWDGRFDAFASTFTSDIEAKARAALTLALPQHWTSQTLAEAPTLLREICDGTGGLRAGQLLFGGATVEGVTPYGLWWPWGGGKTITLRLGFAGADEAALARLRTVFHLA